MFTQQAPTACPLYAYLVHIWLISESQRCSLLARAARIFTAAILQSERLLET